MKKVLLILMLFLSLLNFSQENYDLHLYTDEYPPYNFLEKDKLEGISVDILEEMLQDIGSKLTKNDITVLSWSRAYNLLKKKDNVMLFSMTKTKERERLFKFVGPIAKTRIVLIAKKDRNIRIDSIEDIKKYEVGTIRDGIGEQLLKKKGISEENIQEVSEFAMNIKKLKINRIDLLAFSDITALWFLKRNGEDLEDYEIVYVLEKGEVYFALSSGVSNEIVNEFQTVLDKIKLDGRYEKIMSKYVKSLD